MTNGEDILFFNVYPLTIEQQTMTTAGISSVVTVRLRWSVVVRRSYKESAERCF